MSDVTSQGIVVLDIGSTNVKSTLFDRELNRVQSRTVSSTWPMGAYLSIDVEPVLEFARRSIFEFDQLLPVDAIVPCSHGSALALLDGNGELALPIMAYEAEVPETIGADYQALCPPFDEVFAPVNPGALTLARQLLWQETEHREAFDRVKTILPLAQYVAFRLCGKAVSEVTALGAQTHLWDPVHRCFSGLAVERGWAEKFAPIVHAWQPLGPLIAPSVAGSGTVYAGIHDSNANLLRFLGHDPFCLLSTGTWIIGFDPNVAITGLRPELDQVSNTTIFGDPVACCRFMGGREFELIADGASPSRAAISTANRLIEEGIYALPSFTDSGGPVPGSGGQGRIVGRALEDPGERASLASIYCAQMSAVALQALGTRGTVIVDGPFADNPVYLSVLQHLCRNCKICIAQHENGTSAGAAMLALMRQDRLPDLPTQLRSVEVAPIDGVEGYHKTWLKAL